VLNADRWPDDLPVPWFGPRMICTGRGIIGGRTSELERANGSTLTRVQWR